MNFLSQFFADLVTKYGYTQVFNAGYGLLLFIILLLVVAVIKKWHDSEIQTGVACLLLVCLSVGSFGGYQDWLSGKVPFSQPWMIDLDGLGKIQVGQPRPLSVSAPQSSPSAPDAASKSLERQPASATSVLPANPAAKQDGVGEGLTKEDRPSGSAQIRSRIMLGPGQAVFINVTKPHAPMNLYSPNFKMSSLRTIGADMPLEGTELQIDKKQSLVLLAIDIPMLNSNSQSVALNPSHAVSGQVYIGDIQRPNIPVVVLADIGADGIRPIEQGCCLVGTSEIPKQRRRVYGMIFSFRPFPWPLHAPLTIGKCTYAEPMAPLFDKIGGREVAVFPTNHPVKIVQEIEGWLRVEPTCVSFDLLEKELVLKWFYKTGFPAVGWVKKEHLRHLAVLPAMDQDQLNRALAYMTAFNLVDLINKLVQQGAQVEMSPMPPRDMLSFALRNDGLESFQWLLSQGASLATNAPPTRSCAHEEADLAKTHFTEAIGARSMRVAKYLVAQNVPINIQTCSGPALIMAIQRDPDLAIAMLERGAQVNVQDRCGRPALLFGIETHSLPLLNAFLARGADVNMKFQSRCVQKVQNGRMPASKRNRKKGDIESPLSVATRTAWPEGTAYLRARGARR